MYDIKHLVTIDAPIPVVYMALTEQEGLAGWWTSDTVANPSVGSIAAFQFGDRHHNTMRIEALEPNKRVEWTCLDGDPECRHEASPPAHEGVELVVQPGRLAPAGVVAEPVRVAGEARGRGQDGE